MAKKTVEIPEKIMQSPLEELMEDRFASYAKYVIQDRAIPDARDGLKPVQRRILYAMSKEGNTFDKGYRKSAKTVGVVMGNYHPHGDSSIYEAMVRMSQDWKMELCLIDMQGNNGSVDDDPPAAMRYTEARLAHSADYLLADLEKETVSFQPNFDDTEDEPVVLPASFPNLLVNGAKGIAVGYACDIPTHNLAEVINATTYRINNPNCSLDELMDIIPGPDFPTGGIAQGKKGFRDAFETGRGKIIINSKHEFIPQKNLTQIVVTEIPYGVSKQDIVKQIDEIRFENNINGIIAARDESGRDGIKVVIDIRKDADENAIWNYLKKNTKLQDSYNYNMVAIVNKKPRTLGLIAILDAFIEHREDVVIKRSKFDLDKKEKRCHIIEGFLKMVSVLDEVIKTIRASKNKADAKDNIIAKFGFSLMQAEAIVNLQLYRLTNTDIQALRDEFALLLNEMEELKEIINDKKVLDAVIIKELYEVRDKFSTERKTVLEDEVEEIVIDKTKMVASEQVVLTLSRDGYIKQVSMRSYNAANDSSTGLKDLDHCIGTTITDNLNTLLAFTNMGNYIYLPVYEIDDGKWKDIGNNVSKYAKTGNGEKIVDACLVSDFNTECWIISVTKQGYIKRSLIGNYEVQRYNKAMCAINLAKTDEVVTTLMAYENDEILLSTRDGYVVRYTIDQIPSSSIKSKGVKSMNLTNDDMVAFGCVIRPQDTHLIALTDNSQIKRIKKTDIELMKRPRKGDLIAKKNKSNPAQIRYVFAGGLESIMEMQDSSIHKLAFKEITLMNTAATFASALTINKDWFVYRNIKLIEMHEVKEKDKEINDNGDQITLF